jgi:hypothetical protein
MSDQTSIDSFMGEMRNLETVDLRLTEKGLTPARSANVPNFIIPKKQAQKMDTAQFSNVSA